MKDEKLKKFFEVVSYVLFRNWYFGGDTASGTDSFGWDYGNTGTVHMVGSNCTCDETNYL